MPPPRRGSGPGGHHPTEAANRQIAATLTKHDQPQVSRRPRMPVAHALLLLAMPGAVFDRLLVRTCPICRAYAHVHHVPTGSARNEQIIRSPRCAPHQRYAIEVTDVIPAVATPGQRRRRAAA